MSNLSPIEALKRIEQFSDSGDYATAIVKMKAIATEALAYKGQDEAIEIFNKEMPFILDLLPEDSANRIEKLWKNVYKAGEDLEPAQDELRADKLLKEFGEDSDTSTTFGDLAVVEWFLSNFHLTRKNNL